jgi:hypothetical protein
MSKFTDLLESLTGGTGAKPATEPAAYDPIGEPWAPTEDTFHLTQGPDNMTGYDREAGGYPADVPAGDPFTIADSLGQQNRRSSLSPAPAPAPKLRQYSSVRYVITAADVSSGAPQAVTPSGIDSEHITRVILIASTENAIRIGATGPGAQAGAYLPPWFPVTLETGPVYIVGFVAGATVDVIVETAS